MSVSVVDEMEGQDGLIVEELLDVEECTECLSLSALRVVAERNRHAG